MVEIAINSEVIPLLEEWDVDLEISSRVFLLPKDSKQLQEVNL